MESRIHGDMYVRFGGRHGKTSHRNVIWRPVSSLHIERRHIHIVSVRVDEEGKKIDGNFERHRSMDICRELEQKYGLVPADQKQRQEGLLLKPVRYEDGDVKHQMANVIRSVARDYHFMSLKEYKALLTLYNIRNCFDLTFTLFY